MRYTVRPAAGPEATTSIGPNGPGPLPITVLAEPAADAPLVALANSGIAATAVVMSAAASRRRVLALRRTAAGLDGSARRGAPTAVNRVALGCSVFSLGASGHDLA